MRMILEVLTASTDLFLYFFLHHTEKLSTMFLLLDESSFTAFQDFMSVVLRFFFRVFSTEYEFLEMLFGVIHPERFNTVVAQTK